MGGTTGNVYVEQYVINVPKEQVDLNLKYGSVLACESHNKLYRVNPQEQIIQGIRKRQGNWETPKREHRKRKTETSRLSTCKSSNASNTPNEWITITASWKQNGPKFFPFRRIGWNRGAYLKQTEESGKTTVGGKKIRNYETRNNEKEIWPECAETIWVPSRPNKWSGKENAEIDGELINRANRLGGCYQAIAANETEQNEEIEPEHEEQIEDPEGEGEGQIIRGDNLPIVDLRSDNTDGKEAHYVQINQIVGAVTERKKAAESAIKKAERKFMLDLKTMIAKSSTDAEMNRVKLATTQNDRDMARQGYKQQFNGRWMKWGLILNDDKIIVPNELRKNLLNTLHYGHAGTTKLAEKDKNFRTTLHTENTYRYGSSWIRTLRYKQ